MQSRRFAARESVGRYRARMRAQGFRPIQLWVPDTRSPKFAAECRRQSLAVARRGNGEIEGFLDAAAREIEDWK
jgi:hypothetical protein